MTIRPLKWLTEVTASESAVFEEGLDANSQKIINVNNGSSLADATAYGQLTGLSSSMKTYADNADTVLQENINSASGSIKAYVDSADQTLQSNLNNASSSIISYVDSADTVIQANIDNISSSIVSYVDAAQQTLINNVNAMSSSVVSYADAADSTIQININNASSSIKSYVDARETVLQGNLDAVSASVSSSLVTEENTRISEDNTFLKLDGSRTMSGGLNMGSNDILNVGSGTFAGDFTVQGTLEVDGVLTSLNTTNIEITDKLITIAKAPTGGNTTSAYLDGNGDYLTIPSAAAVDGTEDFTVEMWLYRDSTFSAAYDVLMSNATAGGFSISINSNGTVGFGRSMIVTEGATSTSINLNAWNHIAFSRQSGTLRIYINGQEGYSAANTTSYSVGTIVLGTDGNYSSFPFKGYIDEYRITKGVARYTATFTPAATFALSGDANAADVSVLLNMNGADGDTTFTDSSNNNRTISVGGNTKLSTTNARIAIPSSDGAGINVDGALVNLTYDSASNKWVSDIGLSVAGEASFDAAMKLSGSAFTNISVGITSSKFDVSDAIHELDLQGNYILTDLANAYGASRCVITGTFVVSNGEAATEIVDITSCFPTSSIDGLSVDVSVDQGSGWTYELVSAKLYLSGSSLKVNVDAPAASNGDKYRLIIVDNRAKRLHPTGGALSTNGNTGSSLGNGLIAYYAFENNVNDSSANGLNGTVVSGSGMVYDTGIKGGNSIVGGSSHVQIDSNSLNLYESLTISFWMYVNSDYVNRPPYTGNHVLISREQGDGFNGNKRAYEVLLSGQWLVFKSDSGNSWGAAIQLNARSYLDQWIHVTITRQNDVSTQTNRIYFNGTLIDTVVNAKAESVLGKTYIGIRPDGDWALNNSNIKLDEVAFWNKALSDSEVTQLYNSGAGLSYPDVGSGGGGNSWTSQWWWSLYSNGLP